MWLKVALNKSKKNFNQSLNQKPILLLYSPYYAEACNELAVLMSVT